MTHSLNDKEEQEWQAYLEAKRAKSKRNTMIFGFAVLAVFLIAMLLSVCSGGFNPGLINIVPH